MKALQAIKPLLARLGVKPNQNTDANDGTDCKNYSKHVHKPLTYDILQAFKPFLAFFSVYP